jgi:hypothetical protein
MRNQAVAVDRQMVARSSRRLADPAREVVQDAQLERLAAMARHRAALDQAQVAGDERDRLAEEPDRP